MRVVVCWVVVYFHRIKKGESQGKEKCHAKSMMSNEAHDRLKIDTQIKKLFAFWGEFFFNFSRQDSFFWKCTQRADYSVDEKEEKKKKRSS